MRLPRIFLTKARESSKKFPDDVDEAMKHALESIRILPEFDDYLEELLQEAVLSLIYRARTTSNKYAKAGSRFKVGVDTTPNKVRITESEAVMHAYDNLLDSLFIRGKSLGSLHGGELLAAAASQRAEAEGYNVNAELLEQLHPLVPANKTVREVFGKTKKVQAMLDKIHKKRARPQ